MISDEGIEILKDNCRNIRDLAMLDLLYSTGIRVGELANLNIGDVDFEERVCIVFGKGDKERRVYFDAETQKILGHSQIDTTMQYARPNQNSERPLYVAYYMESDAGKSRLQSKNQSAVKAGLNFNSINILRMMVLPIELQEVFIAFVAQTDKSKLI